MVAKWQPSKGYPHHLNFVVNAMFDYGERGIIKKIKSIVSIFPPTKIHVFLYIRVYLWFLYIAFMLLPFCPYISIYIPQLSL